MLSSDCRLSQDNGFLKVTKRQGSVCAFVRTFANVSGRVGVEGRGLCISNIV